MHARSRNNARTVLIAAISGRALAAAAGLAGYRPLVADFFGDTDTVALAERSAKLPGDLQAGIDADRLIDTLRHLAGDEEPAAVVLGSGFERKADVVDEVARYFPLAGNGAAAIRRVKDPAALAADCAELGIPHPGYRWSAPPDPQNWITKTTGGAGGAHVRHAKGDIPATGRYFQRMVRGPSLSALFIGDGRAARVVGFSRQWTSPIAAAPYRYGGAVRLRRFDRGVAATIGRWLSSLTMRVGLVGLCSADFIRSVDGCQLIEINPRPGATLDIFDSAEAPLFEAHLRAARGDVFDLPRFEDSMASLIAYASAPVAQFPDLAWPEWTADRQAAGSSLIAGDPVCTVFARGSNAGVTRRSAEAQARQLQRCWEASPT
ncbi:ATP-grasp domain-containing protein [Arvimicrobium flavum]|uniref:ATP-grasp domain-containing protein n=1 Tax=Arvimicrobium flavum TaxID=3393320 RepID=UPI00237B6894|nr:ATP-grasp domain-containing protein [Mesorhizobium shangrilense]